MDRSRSALSPARPPRERRADARVRMRFPVAVEATSGTVFLPAADLSASGLRLRGAVDLAPGTPVQLVLELPGEAALPHLPGRVVRTWQGPDAGLAVALDPDGDAPGGDVPGGDAPGGDTPGRRRAIERYLAWRRAS